MPGVGEVRPELAPVVERLHHPHVHQVRPAEVGVADDDHVALGERALVLDDLLRRLLLSPRGRWEPELALGDSWLNGNRGVELLDDGGALDRRPGRRHRTVVDGGLVPRLALSFREVNGVISLGHWSYCAHRCMRVRG